jgi:hypothetical protein
LSKSEQIENQKTQSIAQEKNTRQATLLRQRLLYVILYYSISTQTDQ